jgi:hypothetical protein
MAALGLFAIPQLPRRLVGATVRGRFQGFGNAKNLQAQECRERVLECARKAQEATELSFDVPNSGLD